MGKFNFSFKDIAMVCGMVATTIYGLYSSHNAKELAEKVGKGVDEIMHSDIPEVCERLFIR